MKSLRAGLAIAALTVAAACGGGSDSPAKTKTFVASGSIQLYATGNVDTGDGCYGSNGYDDIRPGAPVVVKDAAGKQLALGKLGQGDTGKYRTCVFDFTVDDIPSGKGPYSVEVSHRGETPFDEKDALSLKLTLGD